MPPIRLADARPSPRSTAGSAFRNSGQSTNIENMEPDLRNRVRQNPQVSSHSAPRMSHRNERQPDLVKTGLMAST